MQITWESRTQYISQESRRVVQEILSEMDKTLGDGVSVRVDIDLNGWLLFFDFKSACCNVVTTRIEGYAVNDIASGSFRATKEMMIREMARGQREKVIGCMMKEIGVYRT